MSGAYLIVLWDDGVEVDTHRMPASHVPALAALCATAERQTALRADGES